MAHASTNLHYIHIREAHVDDAARYTCVATNRAGERRVSTQLLVLGNPSSILDNRALNSPAMYTGKFDAGF